MIPTNPTPPRIGRIVLAFNPCIWDGPAAALVIGVTELLADGSAKVAVTACPDPQRNGTSACCWKGLLSVPLFGVLTPEQREALPRGIVDQGWCEWPPMLQARASQPIPRPAPAPTRAAPMPRIELSVEKIAVATHDGKPFHELSRDAQKASTRRVARVLAHVAGVLTDNFINATVVDEFAADPTKGESPTPRSSTSNPTPSAPSPTPPSTTSPGDRSSATATPSNDASVPGREPSRAELLDSGALTPGDGDKPAAPVAASGDRVEDL